MSDASPRPDAPADSSHVLPDAALGDTNDLLIAGHTYDGIREYDNPMPGWWTALFIAGVLFAPVYLLGINVFGFVDTYEEDLAQGQADLAARAAAWAASGPAFETDARALKRYADDPLMVAAGAEVFAGTCASCHGAEGQGAIGPNLTDAYWLHGGAPEEIYEVLNVGVVSKGMPAWGELLSDEERAQATAYIQSIQGTTPPNPKPREGTRYEGI
ncbi:c-type cytochrome [Rubricoccus marinus]|nr:c-type cytochrome [Rubricoccus marinus]